MPAYQDTKTKKWFTKFYYQDWQGERKVGWKRGFETKREALAYERDFKQTQEGDLNMTFADFMKLYETDRKPRLKLHTWISKEYMIADKLMPYFGKKPMNAIKSTDVIKWQNTLMNMKKDDGKKYSLTYLKTINNQLTAIFNHAVKYYNLKENPCHKVGAMGVKNAKEMNFWTKDEFLKFIDVVDDPECYYAFQVLSGCGFRVGELLALTFADVDTEGRTITINKSYRRLQGKDVITEPKTKKSNRTVTITPTLAEKLEEYKATFYLPEEKDRMFPFTKSRFYPAMTKYAEVAGVKRIRIHDLRHSHVSLLIDMGFSPVAIAERVGHDSIEVTFRYSHLFPSKQVEMADRLEAAMAPAEPDDSFSASKVIEFKKAR
jgi:integrase